MEKKWIWLSGINLSVVPEFVMQGVLCIAYLITRHWFMCLLCLPYLCYDIRLYRRRQHLVDVTEIYNQLNWEKKQRLTKLFYLIMLLISFLFWQGNRRGWNTPNRFPQRFRKQAALDQITR